MAITKKTGLALAILRAQELRDELNAFLDIAEAALKHPKKKAAPKRK